jgi:ornithine cyclodeaminase/alanine dehydrogenase-like protein (mu-crystallin family)
MNDPRGTLTVSIPMLVLSSADVRRLVPMSDAIGTAREAFAAVSRGEIVQPQRMSIADGSTLIMFAKAPRSEAVVKIVSVRPGNAQLGVASLQAIVIAMDETTGQPLAVIEGTSITALRTGAASGLATDLLASPAARILGMVGAGSQAADQVLGVCAVRPIEELRVASRHGASAERLIKSLAGFLDGVECRTVSSPREAVAGADVVCTATTASAPLFDLHDLKDTVHINAVGAHSATMCELPSAVLRHATVLAVDQVAAALQEAGDIVQAIGAGAIGSAGLVEIGTLLESVPPPPRGHGISVFKSVGVAAQDWALVRRVLDRAALTGGLRSLALD